MQKGYHDCVFKCGKLIGDFDNVHIYSEVTPWKQDVAADLLFDEISTIVLKDKAPYDYALVLGCGLIYVM